MTFIAEILIACIVIGIIVIAGVLIINELSPLKQCDEYLNRSDDYIVQFHGTSYSCGELRRIDTAT